MKTDYRTIKVKIEKEVAVLTIDNPPVNQMSPQMGQDLTAAVDEALGEDDVKAVVLTGTGKNFIAGADITQLQAVKDREEIRRIALRVARFLNRVESGPKPFIAAINGNCLGGGLETAMACHSRIAASGVNLGQPEVQIGLIPGAGATQRLPRLIGLPNAVEMITTGKPISAEKALTRGLTDEVVAEEKLLETALRSAQRFVSGELDINLRRTGNRHDRLPSAAEKKAFLAFAKMLTAQKAKGYTAPFKAIEAMEKGLGYNIEADIERELDLFAECAVSDVAKNLIGIFLNTRAAGRLPRIEGIKPAKTKKVAVLGGGVMGSGIVNLLLKNGFETVLWDVNERAIENGLATTRKTFAYPIKKGKMTTTDLEQMIQDLLETTTSLETLTDADLVIEAVLEDMKIKQDIWKQLEEICRSDVIFATNTSALPITEMAAVLSDPGRMIGLHFFNPAERMQLVEIICAQKTSDQTLATTVAFSRAIRKIPIVVNDGPGFYVSRQLGGLFGGAVYLTASGVDGAVLEEAMIEFGMPMGPASLADLTGIDVNYRVNRNFEQRLGKRWEVHPLTEVVYQTGCYGRKTGAGYFDYSGDHPVPNRQVMDAVKAYLDKNGVQPRQMSKQEVEDIMLAAGINEAAYMVEEGICDRPQDMDLAMIYGTGFPPYRGGILRYADKRGIANVYERLLTLEEEYGIHFKPANLLKEMAESGRTFYAD
jgi:3-hydroxyacyl-CoA dehydrogenase/enoyl-CoA hydratase/carnithine racemase